MNMMEIKQLSVDFNERGMNHTFVDSNECGLKNHTAVDFNECGMNPHSLRLNKCGLKNHTTAADLDECKMNHTVLDLLNVGQTTTMVVFNEFETTTEV